MTSAPSPSAIQQIEIFSHWVGFANPPSLSAKLTICNVGKKFLRQQALHSICDELPESAIARLIRTLGHSAIPHLDPTFFDAPAGVIDQHYNSCWTDDSPSHFIHIRCNHGRHITIRSESQHAFMLPLQITDSMAEVPYITFDPELSCALADLMPEGYLERDRLAGRLGMLEWDIKEAEREESGAVPEMAYTRDHYQQTSHVSVSPNESATAPSEPNDDLSGSTLSPENMEAEILRILFGEESEEDADKAELSGRLSERLLKRNSLETAKDLLARGADVSIADDVGQTALMHAAFPPFDRERFRLLVEAGADVEAQRDGLTGLHLACAGGEAEAVVEWIQAKGNIGARSPDGATPLMLGATWPLIVRELLDHGAEVNAVDDDGHSGLVYAILRQSWVGADGQLEAIQAMIDAGAGVNLKDRAEVSPLSHARKIYAEACLEEEVILQFNPAADLTFGMEWNRRRLAEAVVDLLVSSGAFE